MWLDPMHREVRWLPGAQIRDVTGKLSNPVIDYYSYWLFRLAEVKSQKSEGHQKSLQVLGTMGSLEDQEYR